uniref:Uncharacterized protein n=1 Tax=Caulerpa cliftonii TaxID=1004391 RepID=A0A1C9JBK3_9CHLO|nr:hypothetical protein [Caulerpa cliftonii]AOP19235.1 hypothetical protein [Caulerpa cliftonii]
MIVISKFPNPIDLRVWPDTSLGRTDLALKLSFSSLLLNILSARAPDLMLDHDSILDFCCKLLGRASGLIPGPIPWWFDLSQVFVPASFGPSGGRCDRCGRPCSGQIQIPKVVGAKL